MLLDNTRVMDETKDLYELPRFQLMKNTEKLKDSTDYKNVTV